MKKTIIKTSKAPNPIGPYNQAILVNGMLFVSGQVAINPVSNELIISNIKAETQQVMENLKAILEDAAMNFNNVVKATIFLRDINNFVQMNEVYGSYFDKDAAPARETVQVARLPRDVNVEISVIAIRA